MILLSLWLAGLLSPFLVLVVNYNQDDPNEFVKEHLRRQHATLITALASFPFVQTKFSAHLAVSRGKHSSGLQQILTFIVGKPIVTSFITVMFM